MSPQAHGKTGSGWIWLRAFATHALLTCIALEFAGENYLWVMDPVQPWIKDRLTPPLSTLINLPCGVLSSLGALVLASALNRLFRVRGFDLRTFLSAAAVSAFVTALLRGNFVVVTGPLWPHTGNWHIRPEPERWMLSAAAAVVLIGVEGVLLWWLSRGVRPARPALSRTA